MKLVVHKLLFAAYCGMIASGYDLQDMSDPLVKKLCGRIEMLILPEEVCRYFMQAKTNLIAVNPYYPRGSDLSAACFFREKSEYVRFLCDCGSPEAEEPAFLQWIDGLPQILKKIVYWPGFDSLYSDYCKCVSRKFSEVPERLEIIQARLDTINPKQKIALVFAPNLLQSKYLADYALVDNILYLISAEFSAVTAIHEYLHIALKLERDKLAYLVSNYGAEHFVDMEYMKKLGYARVDVVYAVEECIVRALSGVLTDVDREYCAQNAAIGFTAVSTMVRALCAVPWETKSLDNLIKIMVQAVINS